MKAKHVVGAGLIGGAIYLFYKASKGQFDKAAGLGKMRRRLRGVFVAPGQDASYKAVEWYAGQIADTVDNGPLKVDQVNPETGMTQSTAAALGAVHLRGVAPYTMVPVDNVLGRCR